VAMSLDGNGRYCYLSPREGAQLAVAECCRNLSTVGAEPVAATNCLNFGNPERPEIMAQLVEAIEGMADACRFFDTPITGGNVSLYNETLGEGIYPTPVMGIVGVLKTAEPVTIPFKSPGRAWCCWRHRRVRRDAVRRHGVRQGDPETALGAAAGARSGSGKARAIGHPRNRGGGLAESAHDLSDGGLAVALAECCCGSAEIGAAIDLDSDLRPEVLAFHEAPSRILISTAYPGKVAPSRRSTVSRRRWWALQLRKDGNPAGAHDTGFLGNRNAESCLSWRFGTLCSINSTKSAAWWPSTATRRRPNWRTWAVRVAA